MPTQNLDDAKREVKIRELWRFRDLKLLGYAVDRATLRRRIAKDGFPQPIILSGNAIAWVAAEVIEWFNTRARGPSPQSRSLQGAARKSASHASEAI